MELLKELEQYRNELWIMNFDREAMLVERALAEIERLKVKCQQPA